MDLEHVRAVAESSLASPSTTHLLHTTTSLPVPQPQLRFFVLAAELGHFGSSMQTAGTCA